MSYKRKTADEWQLHLYYGHQYGWEETVAEDSFKAVREQQKCYLKNQPEYPSKIVFKRVPISKD